MDGASRSVYQSDRDKIVYSAFLRRLAGVTQVVGAREGHVFHNRLTHTLKVSQLSQRLAERFLHQQQELACKLGIDPSVAEAAALAHDLGHPPFGHVAESELRDRIDRRVAKRSKNGSGDGQEAQREDTACSEPEDPRDDPRDGEKELRAGAVIEVHDESDGFEGNAQSLRIVTRLAVHKPDVEGLNLTRGTLNALLKYPWKRHSKKSDPYKNKKYGAYSTDTKDFEFARSGLPDEQRSVEAEIMDLADSITYSIHDLDDFFRAGLIPLADLLAPWKGKDGSSSPLGDRESTRFLDWWKKHGDEEEAWADEYSTQLFGELRSLYADQLYRGEYQQRGLARRVTSSWIQQVLEAVELLDPDSNDGELILIEPFEKARLSFLQGLVRYYVIESESLATQRRGQRKIVGDLFDIFLEAVCLRDRDSQDLIPGRFSAELARAEEGAGAGSPSDDELRLAADIVASLGDTEAALLFRRLTGVSMGSVTNVSQTYA